MPEIETVYVVSDGQIIQSPTVIVGKAESERISISHTLFNYHH
jgi:hypothetical protein